MNLIEELGVGIATRLRPWAFPLLATFGLVSLLCSFPRLGFAADSARAGANDRGANGNSTGGAPSAGDNAVFNSTFSNQPNFGNNERAGGIWITGNVGQNVAISGSFTLTLSGGTIDGTAGLGILIDNANTYTLAIDAPLKLGGEPTWRSNSDNPFTIGAGGVNFNSRAFTIDGRGNTTVTGVVSDAGAFNKSGSGTLTLSGSNTYVGTTNLSEGVFNVLDAVALGATAAGTTVNGGTALQIQGAIAVGAEAPTLGGVEISRDDVLRISSGNNSLSGNLTLASASTISPDSGTLTLSGTLTNGGFGLTIAGAGATGASLVLGDIANGDLPLIIGGNPDSSEIISGSGGFAEAGTGTMAFGSVNTYALANNSSAGTLRTSANTSNPTDLLTGSRSPATTKSGDAPAGQEAPAATFIWSGGSANNLWSTGANWAGTAPANDGTAAVQFAGSTRLTPDMDANWNINSLTFNAGAGAFTLGSTGAFTLTIQGGGITNNSTNLQTINNKIALNIGQTWNAASGAITATGVISGTGGLTKTGANLLTLTGANTFTGILSIAVNGGPVNIQSDTALGATGGSSYTLINSGGAVQLQNGITVAEQFQLLGDGVASTGSLRNISGNNTITGTVYLWMSSTIGADAGTLTLGGVISQDVAGLGLTKVGAGTVVLSAANTYTGAVAVNAGVLNVQDNAGLGTAAGGVSVSSGATLQLQNNITVGAEALNIKGAGASGQTGALVNVSGTNNYGGLLTLAGATTISSDSGTLNLTNGGTITGATFGLTLAGTGNGTVSSIIGTTSGTLTKSGAGTWTLSGASTYTGATTVSAGVLNIQNATALGTTAGGTTVSAGAALQLQGNIAVGTESLLLNGSGIASDGALRNISGTNSYSGAVTLGSASTVYSDAGTLTLSGTIAESTFLMTFDGPGNVIANKAISGSGGLTKNGAGTLTLSGTNTYTGTNTMNGGTVVINSASSLGAIGNATTLNAATLEAAATIAETRAFTLGSATSTIMVDPSQTFTVNTGIAGAGGLTKTGSGTLTLSTTNTYAGATTVSAGTLNVTGSLTSAITVASGGTLSGQGGTTNSTLALSAGSTILGVAQVAGSGNAFRAAGTVTAGSTVKISGSDGSATVGAGHSIDVVGYGTTPGTANFSTANYRSATLADDTTNKKITLTYTNASRTWNSAASAWDVGTTTAWQEGDLKFFQGDTVTFDDTGLGGGGARTVTLNTLVTPGGVAFNNATSTYTVSGTGSIGGATALTKTGAGTVTLATANSYTGATTVSAGTLQTTGVGAFNGTSGLLIQSGGIVHNSSGNTFGAGFYFGSGRTATVTGTGSQWTHTNSLYIGDAGTGNQLTISGGGSVTSAVDAGLGNSAGGNSNSVTITGAGSIWNNTGSFYDGITGNNNTLSILSGGRLSTSGSGHIGFYAVATGNTATVDGTSSLWSITNDLFVGNAGSSSQLTISNGGQVTNRDGWIGAGSASTSNIVTVTGTSALWANSRDVLFGSFGTNNQLNITSGGTVTVAGTMYVGKNGGSGNVLTVTNGTLSVTNAGTAVMDVRRGSVVFNSGTISADSLLLNTGASGTFTFNGGMLTTGATTVANGSAFVVGDGTSSAVFNFGSPGAHSFANGLTVSNNARAVLTTGNVTATPGVTVNSGGAIELYSNITVTPSLTLNGSGISGSGGLRNISGNNTWSGAITLGSASRINSDAGTLTLGGAMANAGSTLTVGGAAGTTISGAVSGTGGLTKDGAGTLTLSSANTFSGTTTVNAGTLIAAASSGSALGSTNSITLKAPGTLTLGASDQINNSATMTLAGGTFAKGGFGEGTASAFGVGLLSLTAAGSHIDFGTGTVGVLSFAGFNSGGFTFAIDNWTGTANTVGSASTDRLIFNADQTFNLAVFNFNGYLPGAVEFNLGGGFYEVVPFGVVPEPANYIVGLFAFGVIGFHWRRRLCALFFGTGLSDARQTERKSC